MKNNLLIKPALIILLTIPSLISVSQAPHQLNYQAVVRDETGNPITDTDIEVVFIIRQYMVDGSDVFFETHNVATNSFGLINLMIGSIEDLAAVPWDDGPFFLKVDIDGSELGITQLLSVPYSLFSDVALSVTSEADPVFLGSAAGTIGSTNIGRWDQAFNWGNHADAGYINSTNWTLNQDKLFFNDGYVGIGNENPQSKLAVMGKSNEDTILFEVKNSLGQTVFAVYNQGVHITIDEAYSKGARGGFSVGGFDRAKGLQEYLRVTADSTRVSVNQNAKKGARGGFAVGGFDRTPGKTALYNYVDLTPYNSLIGHSAGANMEGGVNNFFGGYEAGFMNITGVNNVFIGTGAGKNNNSNANVFIGNQAGTGNTSGFGSVIIGDGSGILNNGSRNIFIGRYTAESNTSGYNNVYIGNDAGSEMTTGIYNTFLGAEAGDFAAAGDYDVYVGTRAGYDNDGSNNVVMGYVAGANGENYGNDNTTYSNSVMLGSRAGYLITTGANNVFVGYGSGGNMTSGYRNTLVGAASGSSTLGSNNVLIGYGAGSGVSGDNKLVIHNWNTGTPLVYGEFHSVPSAALFRINGAFEVTEMGVGSGTPVVIDASGEVLKTSSSLKYKNNITSLNSVTNLFMRLRPVSFKWNEISATPGKEDFGLIAEEVFEVLPELAITNKDGSAEGVSYHNVNIMAIKVIQSQQKEIEELKRRLEETEEKINSILKKME